MNKKKGRKPKKPNKEIFEMMYYNDSISAENLAQTYGVKPQTIYNWAQQFKKEQNIEK